jgi:hypothetical protein
LISRIHNKLGTAGFIVAIVALVAALSGVAIAAGGSLTGKQKKEVKNISKTEAKKYANSNPGAPGLPGPAGPQGPKGDAGNPGSNGTDGTDGEDGKSVTVSSFTGTKGTCTEEQGGLEVKSASPTAFVCNGKDGTTGNASMTGEWGTGAVFGAVTTGEGLKLITIDSRPVVVSFPAALATAPTVVWMKKGETESYFGDTTKCTGTAAAPTAASGFLCLYTGQIDKKFAGPPNTPADPASNEGDPAEVTKYGFVDYLILEAQGFAQGSWAVTP